MDIIISIASPLIAVFAAVIAYRTMRETRRIAQYQTNIETLIEVEKELKNDVNLLKLHNIETDFLEEEGISATELSYIIASFRAGSAYYVLGNKNDSRLSDYRKNLLDNKKVKLVYEKVIRGKIIPHGLLIKLIDEYYASQEHTTNTNQK